MARLGRGMPVQAVIVRGAAAASDTALAGACTLTFALAGDASLPDTPLAAAAALDLALAGDLTVAVAVALAAAASLDFTLAGVLFGLHDFHSVGVRAPASALDSGERAPAGAFAGVGGRG